MDYMMGRNGFYGRKNFMDYMVSKIIRIIWWVGLYGEQDYIDYMVGRNGLYGELDYMVGRTICGEPSHCVTVSRMRLKQCLDRSPA